MHSELLNAGERYIIGNLASSRPVSLLFLDPNDDVTFRTVSLAKSSAASEDTRFILRRVNLEAVQKIRVDERQRSVKRFSLDLHLE